MVLPAGMRVAHLIETDGLGGAERVLLHLAMTFQADGLQNLVVLPAGGEGWLSSTAIAAGIQVERLRLPCPLSASFARNLTHALVRRRIGLVHSHEFTMAVYGAWAAWRAGIPHVITLHGSRYYAQRWRRRAALRAAISRCQGVVTVSSQLRSAASRDLRLSADRILTVPNGVPAMGACSSTLRQELGLHPSHQLLVAIGNLYSVKGHRYLLAALPSILQHHPQVHVVIAGRGDEQRALEAQTQNLGLVHRVHLLGLRSDVPNILSAADIFVLPSLSEGAPLALLEAMFAGCPVVASDVGDVRRILDNGKAGLLVPPGDVIALAAGINHLLAQPDAARGMGTRAKERAHAEYSVNRMAERYARLYQNALSHFRDKGIITNDLADAVEPEMQLSS